MITPSSAAASSAGASSSTASSAAGAASSLTSSSAAGAAGAGAAACDPPQPTKSVEPLLRWEERLKLFSSFGNFLPYKFELQRSIPLMFLY